MALFKKRIPPAQPASGAAQAVPSAKPQAGPAAAPSTPAAAPTRTIKPAEYGLVVREQIRTDRACADPGLDALAELADRGDWKSLQAACAAMRGDWERRHVIFNALAVKSDDGDAAWLKTWLQASPEDPAALAIQARALVTRAWKIRGGGWGKDVSAGAALNFHQTLQLVPPICRRAASLDPADPGALVMLQSAAMGLSWSHEQFRKLWSDIRARSPHHTSAHLNAMMYWLPRWFGSTELVTGFVDEAIAEAPVGSLLTLARLEMLYLEGNLLKGAERTAYYRGEVVASAIEGAVKDLEAADPGHAARPTMHHWLASFYTKAGRFPEALREFRIVGGYCGSWPWTNFNDPLKNFTATRADAVLGWEDAGRPTLPNGEQP